MQILQTPDRNLALLLGRALDAQQCIVHANYLHRLRDSDELYMLTNSTPNGIFTILSDCYSPTCTRLNLCYSVSCPRRLEQYTLLEANNASSYSLGKYLTLIVECWY
jgi:RHO1 GDP-GTP exchange protein 1/2